jgi:hypothetical protein
MMGLLVWQCALRLHERLHCGKRSEHVAFIVGGATFRMIAASRRNPNDVVARRAVHLMFMSELAKFHATIRG